MSIITEEMVERALLAAVNCERALFEMPPRDDVPASVGPDTRIAKIVRAALAAVAPMIAQAERERCLAVARRWTRDGQSATAHGIILGIEELDAIRARSTEDTTP